MSKNWRFWNFSRDTWNRKKKQKSEASIFMHRERHYFDALKNNEFFDTHENIYKSTSKGVHNQDEYVHPLGSLNAPNLVKGANETLKLQAEEGVSHKLEINFYDGYSTELAGNFLNVIEFYVTDLSGSRKHLGTVGGSAIEQDFSFQKDVNPNLFYLEDGDTLDFVYQKKSNQTGVENRLIVEQFDTNSHKIKIMDGENNHIASAIAKFVPANSKTDRISLDPTSRTSSSDTFFKINAGQKFSISLDAIAAMRNTIGIVKVDIDPITGEATFNGFETDSNEFDQAVRNALSSHAAGFTTQALDPGVQNKTIQWTAGEEGYYAPAMITEKDKLFVLDHTLDDTTHTRIVGEWTAAFEDTSRQNQSDFDFNDIIFQLTPVG